METHHVTVFINVLLTPINRPVYTCEYMQLSTLKSIAVELAKFFILSEYI